MKKIWSVWVLPVFVFGLAGAVSAESFLGAPLVPDAKITTKSKERVEMFSPRSHDEVVAFYKEAFHSTQDIKFRDWSDSTYIEDDGALKWHSITISKEKTDRGTSIVIMKDNWSWIIGTLILRFIGVFVVLLILYLFMSLSGALISRYTGKAEPKKA